MVVLGLIKLMADNTAPDIYGWVKNGGLIGILVAAVYGNYRGWWVSGREVRRMENRIKYLEESNIKWMEIAFKSTKITEEVTPLIREMKSETS